MSKTIKMGDVNLDYDGIGRLLKSDEVLNVCIGEANKQCNADQHIKAFIGFDRAHALIYWNTKENT